mgnify:CR=1 FL=1
MRMLNRNIATLLIGVFAFFFCGNTVFIHSHVVNGARVVHSHPFLPGDHHGHTQNALHFIAAYNLMAATMECGETLHLQQPARALLDSVEMLPVLECAPAYTDVLPGRGPPVC